MKKVTAILCAVVLMLGCSVFSLSSDAFAEQNSKKPSDPVVSSPSFTFEDIPEMTDSAVIELNSGFPEFYLKELYSEEYTALSELDELGRVGPAMACIGKDSFPSDSRTPASSITPTGWSSTTYDDLISDRYLFNRCHILGYQISGINDDERNLFTGSSFLNTSCMLQYESKITEYVSSTENHVIYRVTPVFNEDELVPRGIILEAFSVEDLGRGICLNLFIYNVQPGIIINYADGSSEPDPDYDPAGTPLVTSAPASNEELLALYSNEEPSNGSGLKSYLTTSVVDVDPSSGGTLASPEVTYILNTNSKKFHYPTCTSAKSIKDKNKKEFFGTREEVISMGYSPCGNCNP